MAFESSGNLFVGDASIQRVVKFASGVPSTFASGLVSPEGLTFDSSGNLFVASYGGSIYEFLNTSGTLSSTPTTLASGLGHLNSVAFDSSGNLFATETGSSLNSSSIYEFINTGTLSPTPITFASGLDGVLSLALEPAVVPEPSTMALSAMGGLAGLLQFRRRRLNKMR